MKENNNIKGKDLIIYHGKRVLGPEFNLDDPQREFIYRNLYFYFSGNPAGEYDPCCSLLVVGNLGVGKSVCFKTMQGVFPHLFYRLPAKRMKHLVKQNGVDQTIKDFGYTFKKNLLIDDLGTEDPEKKIYGDTPDVFIDLFWEREELYADTHKQFKTHIIANLTTDEIEEAYGERILDRMLGMAKEKNLITWEGKSLRTSWI